VPGGELRGPFTLPSKVYGGTEHTYWVYVPAQYDPAAQASLMIFNDGQAMGGAILPEMMRWLWRDQPVSTDPRDTVERSFRVPNARP
jgi:hypothetical protein